MSLEIKAKPQDHSAYYGIYQVYDKVSEKFGPIFEQVNHNSAVRSVNTMQLATPDDFSLYCIGHIILGKIKAYEKPEKIQWVQDKK